MVGAVLDGYGVVRSGPGVALADSTLVFLTASHHLEAHKHADCLSLIWQERGESLLADAGKYGYQRDRMRRYFRSTRAHDTVEADGRDWSRATADAYGAGLRRVEPAGAGWLLEAEALASPRGPDATAASRCSARTASFWSSTRSPPFRQSAGPGPCGRGSPGSVPAPPRRLDRLRGTSPPGMRWRPAAPASPASPPAAASR